MSSASQRLSWLGRAAVFVGVAAGLVWLSTLEMPKTDTSTPPSSTSATTASAATNATPGKTAKLGSPKGKELRTQDGKVYPFIQRAYEPAHRLPLLDEPVKPAGLSSPEEVVTSLASAIRQLDWPWFLGLWDEDSRAYMTAIMEHSNLTPAHRLAQWRRNYVGKELQVTRRIDMEGYALLSVSPTDGPRETWDKIPPLATKRDAAGRWWLTHDLRDHPVQAMDMGLAQVIVIDRAVGP